MKRYISCCWVFVLTATVLSSCCPEQPQVGIADVKSDNWREYLGKAVTLRGYYVSRPAPMLVSSMSFLDINAPIPETQYVRLMGEGLDELGPEESHGAYVELTGIVQASSDTVTRLMTEKFGEVWAVILDVAAAPRVIRRGGPEPVAVLFCELHPRICEGMIILQDRYAILLSGGINKWNAHMRYWNDLKFMYLTLKNTYGFADANIIVVYKDGVAEDNEMKVDFAANTAGLDSAFMYVSNRMRSRDLFFFFATNHGGGYNMDDWVQNWGGRLDTTVDETDEAIFEDLLNSDLNGDNDQIDQVRYDEVIYLYESAQDLWDDDLAAYLSDLSYGRMVVVLEPCFSGGHLADLRGPNRIIISASSEYEFSWGGGPGNHDEFSYYFTAALNGATHDGTPVNADVNGDGVVSIVEAFEYAVANDSQPETPWYEDDGDGRGHPGPLPQDGDGVWGATVSLN